MSFIKIFAVHCLLTFAILIFVYLVNAGAPVQHPSGSVMSMMDALLPFEIKLEIFFEVFKISLLYIFWVLFQSVLTYRALERFKLKKSEVLSIHLMTNLLFNFGLLVLNRWSYPDSKFALAGLEQGGEPILFGKIILVASLVILFMFIISLLFDVKNALLPQTRHVILSLTVTLCVLFLFIRGSDVEPLEQHIANEKPHVFILGVDSFRLDHMRPEITPHISQFVANGVSMTQAYTPLARTFPSWVSILSGRYPANNGARFNLTPPQMIRDKQKMLPSVLKSYGYNTLFAMDERKFSAIDEGYGFDILVGPEPGASEFILTFLADNPLMNLFSQTPFVTALFPELVNNRAVWQTYRPNQFTTSISNKIIQLSSSGSVFAAAHFCIPHWPYHVDAGDIVLPDVDSTLRGDYINALQIADIQVSQVLQALQRYGLLNNAIVILLSDHGESFSPYDDQPIVINGEEKILRFKGHGSNLLNLSENHILMSYQVFIDGKRVSNSRKINSFASTTDVMPTILDLLNIDESQASNTDGLSWKDWIVEEAEDNLDRTLLFETGLFLEQFAKTDFSIEEVFIERAKHYKVDLSGRAQLQEDAFHSFLNQKDYAILDKSEQLIFMSEESNGYQVSELGNRICIKDGVIASAQHCNVMQKTEFLCQSIPEKQLQAKWCNNGH